MTGNKKDGAPEQGEKKCGKLRKALTLIFEIVILALVVVSYSLPMPWRIIGPLTIGTITIIIRSIRREKK